MSENEVLTVSAPPAEAEILQKRVEELEEQLAALEARVPDIWILSNNLLKRAFGVYGYYLLAAMIIAIPIFACSMLGMFFFGAFGHDRRKRFLRIFGPILKPLPAGRLSVKMVSVSKHLIKLVSLLNDLEATHGPSNCS